MGGEKKKVGERLGQNLSFHNWAAKGGYRCGRCGSEGEPACCGVEVTGEMEKGQRQEASSEDTVILVSWEKSDHLIQPSSSVSNLPDLPGGIA